MLNVHLYFVKLFGCHIAGNAIPLDIARFANAILHQKAHPCVYVKFGCGRTSAGEPMTGMSDMWLAPSLPGKTSTFATWFYDIGAVAINVMFAVDGERRQGLVGAWHPRQGTTLLTMADYRRNRQMNSSAGVASPLALLSARRAAGVCRAEAESGGSGCEPGVRPWHFQGGRQVKDALIYAGRNRPRELTLLKWGAIRISVYIIDFMLIFAL